MQVLNDFKGLAKLRNIVVEANVSQYSRAVAESNFAARKQENVLPQVKNIFASQT